MDKICAVKSLFTNQYYQHDLVQLVNLVGFWDDLHFHGLVARPYKA